MQQTVSLAGAWNIVFDPKNEGLKKGYAGKLPKGKPIAVPGVWEQVKPGYDGVGWYGRTFRVEPEWHGKVIRLEIGAAHYYADVFVNGVRVGSHEGGYTPFTFDVSRRVKPGDNDLVVRVINPPMNEAVEGFRAGAPLNQSDLPTGKAGWYFNFGGIWQDVKLIVTEKAYIRDCFVEPFIWKKQARVNLEIVNAGRAGSYMVGCRITPRKDPGNTAAARTRRVKLKAGPNRIRMLLDFESVRLWSDTDPFLYTAAVEIDGPAGPVHRLAVNFGMREFLIRNGEFVLNGKKIILKGFLQQGVYPRTLCYPHTEEFARKEIRMCKDAGFNYLRMHIKTAPPISLELADEIGILLSEEPPSGWIGKSPHSVGRLKNEAREMILRDRNHPSIVMWCLLNEIVNFRGFTVAEKMALKARLARDGRQYDPSRLLIDNAGGAPDPKHPHDQIMLPYSRRQVGMLNPMAYCQLPLQDASLVAYRTMGEKGRLLFTHEFGAPEVAPDYRKVMGRYTQAERKLGLEDYILHRDFYTSLKGYFRKAGLKAIFGSVEGMIRTANEARAVEIKHILAAMRSNPHYDGTALCQLADASGELFGAVDIWREPKPLWHAMTVAARTPYLAPEVLPRVIGAAGGTVTLRATLINENQRGCRYTYVVRVVSDTGKTLKKSTGTVRAGRGVQTVLLKKTALKLPAGRYYLVAELFEKGRSVSRDDMRFTVIAAAPVAVPAVEVHDPTGTMTAYLRDRKVSVGPFTNNSREKNIPLLFDLRMPVTASWMLSELFGQLKKCVQLGGCAVLFESDPVILYRFLFPTLINQEGGGMGRGMEYIEKHPIFAGLPQRTLMEYEYAGVYPQKYAKGTDVVRAGGSIVSANLDSHMWTRPACYFWRVSSAVVPVGRGNVILCNLRVLDGLGKDHVADRLFANIINYARTLIRKGGEEKLLSRCIDPLRPADYR